MVKIPSARELNRMARQDAAESARLLRKVANRHSRASDTAERGLELAEQAEREARSDVFWGE